MKKAILTFVIALIAILGCNAQSIETEKVFGGYSFSQDGRVLTMKELAEVLKSDNEAYQLIKPAKSNHVLAQIIGGTGGFLVGYTLGTALGGEEAEWSVAGVGAGLVIISIPIFAKSARQAKKAVELYNGKIASASNYRFTPQFKFATSGNGIGLTMSF